MTITTTRPFTKLEIARIGRNYSEQYWKAFREEFEVQYKYRGEIRTRIESRPTEKARAIRDLLDSNPIFKCPCCGEMMTYNDLEYWLGSAADAAADEVLCSGCYEDGMGEDL